MRLVLMLVSLLGSACASRFDLKAPITVPFDAAIVLGCPSQENGRPSLCQLGRALQASLLWEEGSVKYFITSGAAVHTPYIEAEALAQLMVAAGVPADRIYLEPNALHTDENVFNGLQIARAKGWRRLAVLSDRGHSAFGCLFLTGYGSDCVALSVDMTAVRARHALVADRVDVVRATRVTSFQTLSEREKQTYRETGRYRPPSFLLYPSIAMMRSNGEIWMPPRVPKVAHVACYGDQLR